MKVHLLIYILLPISILSGCDGLPFESGNERDDTISDVRIDAVVVTPNPAIAGDTITFKVLIDDSLRTDLVYTWVLPNRDGLSQFQRTITEKAILRWHSNRVPAGDYEGSITIDDPKTNPGLPPSKVFDFSIGVVSSSLQHQ